MLSARRYCFSLPVPKSPRTRKASLPEGSAGAGAGSLAPVGTIEDTQRRRPDRRRRLADGVVSSPTRTSPGHHHAIVRQVLNIDELPYVTARRGGKQADCGERESQT